MKKSNRLANAEEIQAAYQKLADGITAVMELESTDSYIYNLLTELAAEIWNTSANQDRAGAVKWQLAHAAEWKAEQLKEVN